MPRFSFPHDQTPPEPPDVCELAVFPVAVVPYALGALESRATVYTWSEDGYLRGEQLIRSLQMALLCGGIRQITDRQDALYTMLASAIYGTDYAVVSTDPELELSPAIDPVHPLTIDDPDSLLGRAEDMRQLLQNGINGTPTALYDRENGVRDLLEQLLTAVEASDDLDADMLAKLVEIALALA